MSNDVILSVKNVGKKYCRSLKRTLVYGVQDVAKDVFGIPSASMDLRRDEFWARKDLSFEVKRGECLGLIGANGAGKSTLLKLLNGVILPDTGKIRVRGRVGGLLELGAGFHPQLTGRENIYLNGAILGLTKRQIDENFDAIVDFADIGDFINSPVKFYSSGMYVRLGFAVAAQLHPDILLVDEILAVGDMEFRVKCMNRIWSLLNLGVSVILVSHNMYHIEAFAQRAMLIEDGTMKCEGQAALVINEYQSRVASRTIKLSEPSATGPLRFTDIRLSSEGDELVKVNDWPTIETNRHLAITVRYELENCIAGGIQIGLLIKNAEGHRVAGFTTGLDGRRLTGESGRYEIKFDFDNNLLLDGQYYCGLSSFNMDYSHSLGHWESASKFRVLTLDHDGLSAVGNVLLPHRLTLSELKT